ncbi:glycosyl transferase family 2 [Gramella sp. Hel_I_59]|uniref:glycosyltransferase family 2 protein n=1 Tax=Gramella sp. Hel_I_59 TaxID=1249978 RepID=UPI00114DD0E0|nr:glycosyltransferase family A protein [Gramella sp. Hel_I_59]TQI71542.1 glycosyl transferase family 2 [Gramella sp. Hel_I_59]
MNNPIISVIIPVYNREHLIGETLDSVLEQTYTNWECIIVDDGSNDNTAYVVRSYVERDDRFKFFLRPEDRKKGASPSRNYGLENAKGVYIQFLDSDDLLHCSKFEEQLKVLIKEPALSIATCKWGSFRDPARLNVKHEYYSYQNFKDSLELLYGFGRKNEYFPPIVYLVPKEVIDKAGYWDETIVKNPNDDGEYFTRVMLNSANIFFCDTTEVYYRAGDESRLSLLDEEQKIRSVIESWKMINSNLSKYPKIRMMYVGNGIENIYNTICDSRPDLIEEYSEFFKKRKSQLSWYQKLKNSL